MTWHAYLLSCADGTLYCGITNDLARRLAEHNGEAASGAGAKYTRSRRPVRLAACAPCADKPAALRLELAVKKRPRAAKLAFLLGRPGALAQMPGSALPKDIVPEDILPEDAVQTHVPSEQAPAHAANQPQRESHLREPLS